MQAPIQLLHAADPVPSLVQQCSSTIASSSCPESVCSCLVATFALAPALDHLQTQLLTFLAQHLAHVVECDPVGFAGLSGPVIEQLLLCPALVRGIPCLVRHQHSPEHSAQGHCCGCASWEGSCSVRLRNEVMH